jgi:predicted acetyltransferase
MSIESDTADDASRVPAHPAAPSTPPHLAEPRLTGLTADRFDAFDLAEQRGFQEETPAEHRELDRQLVDPTRFFGFTVGERWVSTFGSFARQLTVPGGAAIPVSAVTSVTVHSAYHRRGLLRRSMLHEFERCRERGEAIAALYASESSIYGRFGYGNAASDAVLSGRTGALGLRDEVAVALDAAGGSVDEVPREAFVGMVRELHDRLRADRPGSLDRPDAWWNATLSDPPAWREGATALRCVVSYDAAGGVDGQATYQFKEGEDAGNAAGEVRIREVEAESAVAWARLWRYLTTLDLARTFSMERAPVGHALRHLVADPRAVVTRLQDALYVRLLDVATALSTRRYATAIDTVMEIVDPMLPDVAGRYALRGSPEEAEASRTDRDADMTLSVRDLASAYLGETSLSALHAAGLVAEHRPGAVARAATAFGWPTAPFCADMF